MLWRDLAGRLYGVVGWINVFRDAGQPIGRLGERIDPIIEILDQLLEEARDCGGDDPTDLQPPLGAGTVGRPRDK